MGSLQGDETMLDIYTHVDWLVAMPHCLILACHNSKWYPIVCMAPMVHAPNDKRAGVLGGLIPDLDQGITELLDSLRCNLPASDEWKHNGSSRRVILHHFIDMLPQTIIIMHPRAASSDPDPNQMQTGDKTVVRRVKTVSGLHL